MLSSNQGVKIAMKIQRIKKNNTYTKNIHRIILLIIMVCFLTGCQKETPQKDIMKYQEMEKKIFNAANKNLEATGISNTITSNEFLITNGYLKAADILDENGKACEGYALSKNDYDKKCIEVYIKCDDYQTEGYGKWNLDSTCQNIREYNDEIKISKVNILEGESTEQAITEFAIPYRFNKSKLYYYQIKEVEIIDTENNVYHLKNLLDENKLSIEGLKVYLEAMATEDKMTKIILDDGRPDDGTRVYRNDDYTVIMCNNGYDFHDVYIGPTTMSFYSKFGTRRICE